MKPVEEHIHQWWTRNGHHRKWLVACVLHLDILSATGLISACQWIPSVSTLGWKEKYKPVGLHPNVQSNRLNVQQIQLRIAFSNQHPFSGGSQWLVGLFYMRRSRFGPTQPPPLVSALISQCMQRTLSECQPLSFKFTTSFSMEHPPRSAVLAGERHSSLYHLTTFRSWCSTVCPISIVVPRSL